MDLKDINEATMPFHYHILRSDDIIDWVTAGGPNMFTELDAKTGYHQVPIAEDTKPMMAYISANGQYEYNYMLMGSRNCTQFFQKVQEDILRDMLWKTVVVYVDNTYVKTPRDEFGSAPTGRRSSR